MKKTYLGMIALSLTCCFGYAQNTFPVPTGNVGIGTTSPTSALHILAPNPEIMLMDNHYNPGNGSLFGKITFGSSDRWASIEAVREGSLLDDVSNLIFKTSWSAGAGGGDNNKNKERMRINYGGFVGIGTDNPLGLLHLKMTNSFSLIERTAGSAYAGHYYVTGTGGALDYNFFTGLRENSDAFHIMNGYEGQDAMTITRSGSYVGIGTMTPGNKLEVVGSAIINPDNSVGSYTEGLRINNANDSYSVLHLGGAAGSVNNTGAGQWDMLKDPYNNFHIWENGHSYFTMLNTTGYIGIGTDAPVDAFTVKTGTINTSTLGGNYLRLKSWTGTAGGSADPIFGGGTVSSVITSGMAALTFNVDQAVNVGATDNGTEMMRVLGNGNVGIGSKNPGTRLTLGGGTSNPNPNVGAEVDYAGLNLLFRGEHPDGGYSDLGSIKMVQPNTAYVDAADMVFSTSFGSMGEKMRISRSGAVGIGTIAPDAAYKLSVNGTIRTKEVKVEAGWSDYVFDKGYALRPLAEVAAYIEKNKHLPDVPSAAEVAKNGVNVGETESLLLKKIEELTLYLIEKDKKEKAQEERIRKLEAAVAKLAENK